VKILVGFPGGSTPDIAARVLAEALGKAWGQTVVVENRPGAAGNIAADAVAKARDEHTLGVVINGNLTTARLLNPRLPFDPARDFHFVSLLATAPLVLVTNPDKPEGAAFFNAARTGGKAWSYGSVGIGSVGHLGMEALLAKAGVAGATHVPYNGNPAVITALIGGQVQMGLMPPGIALPQAKEGKIRVIGVTGPRSPLAPGVEPLNTMGVALEDLEVWTAVVGPAGLQRRIGVVSFEMEGAHPHDACQILDSLGVACRGGHHCAQPLMDRLDIAGTTRASIALYNDAADIDALLDGLGEVARRLG
jgi:tripartite-type tricarboxylate transporter receptor subunit TctC